jgi:hypothetical protein
MTPQKREALRRAQAHGDVEGALSPAASMTRYRGLGDKLAQVFAEKRLLAATAEDLADPAILGGQPTAVFTDGMTLQGPVRILIAAHPWTSTAVLARLLHDEQEIAKVAAAHISCDLDVLGQGPWSVPTYAQLVELIHQAAGGPVDPDTRQAVLHLLVEMEPAAGRTAAGDLIAAALAALR